MAIENLRYSVEVLPPDQRCVEAVVAPVEDLTAARVVFDRRSATNPHRCSVAFHEGSGTVLLSALFTNSTESIADPS